MTRYLSLSLVLLGLFFIASAGCGGGGGTPTVVEPTEPYVESDTEKEMQSAEYEKAMSEMQ